MKEIPTIKPGQVYLYVVGHGYEELAVLEVKGEFIKLELRGWVPRLEFKINAKQLLGRWKYFLGIRLWRIE